MTEEESKKILALNLQYYMNKEKIDRNELCQILGFKYSTVSEWLQGKKYPRIDKIEALANYFGIKKSDLIEEHKENQDESIYDRFDNIKPLQLKKFPMLGEIACGEPIWADEDHESFIMADMDINADFCLTAKGDSMINARIYDGDYVFIRKMSMVENGEIAAVIIDNEATLKRVYYYPEKNKLILNPENPAFEPLVYMNEELDEIRILGKAVCFMSSL